MPTVQHIDCSAIVSKKMCDALTSYVFSISAAKGGVDEFVVYPLTGGGNPSSGMELYNFFKARPELAGLNSARFELLNNSARLIANLVSDLRCGSFHSVDDCVGSQVMDHVPKAWKCDEVALRQFPMQALRLTANIGDLIVRTCDDRDRHQELAVVMLEFQHGRGHEGCVLRCGA